MPSGGLNKKDKILKENGLVTINDIKNALNRSRATIETVISYLYIEPKEIIGSHKFFSNDDFEKIKSFYIEHPDFNTFLAKEMRIRKYGKNPYENRDIKTKQTLLKKYGENYQQILNEKRNSSIKEKYGDKNYRNISQYKETLYKNRNDFCKQNNCSEYAKIFKNKYQHSKETLEKCLNNCNIKLINYKTVLYIKNEDIEKLQNELDRIKYCKTSFSEKEIADFVKSLGFEVIENDRNIIKPKELDIYIPNKNVAIEFDGLFYHNELFIDKNYHLNKTIECEKLGIRLIHIFEDEWLYKKDICKSIIKSALGIYDRKIFARKCIIKELDTQTYYDFLNLNHLQSYTMSKYKIGLFYNNELVQCIGVSSSRFEKGKIELVRLCTKQNTQVLGGFSKLLSYLNKTYNIKSIISYVDRRVFNGIGYKNANFKIIGYSKPSYQYCKELDRFNRLNFQKKNLPKKLKIFDKNLSEHQNMLNNQYYRIYDCGTIKVELNF